MTTAIHQHNKDALKTSILRLLSDGMIRRTREICRGLGMNPDNATDFGDVSDCMQELKHAGKVVHDKKTDWKGVPQPPPQQETLPLKPPPTRIRLLTHTYEVPAGANVSAVESMEIKEGKFVISMSLWADGRRIEAVGE